MFKKVIMMSVILSSLAGATVLAQWSTPKAPVIPEADGYVVIPNSAVPPEKDHIYKAIFEASDLPDKYTDLLPALNMAGSELNAFGVEGIPNENIKFAVVFHGPAVYGILENNYYKEKYGVDNPNLKVLSELKKSGVELFVCGQYLASADIDPKNLAPEIIIASDAYIVLMTYHDKGYSILCF